MGMDDSISDDRWDSWHAENGPKYPHEKVVQYCFRNYGPRDRSGVRALDLGCGNGVHTIFLAREGFPVTGLDASKAGISVARRCLQDSGLIATLKIGRIESLDFPADSFDLVICVGVLDAAGPTSARASITQLSDVLTLGGRGLFLFASDRDFRVGVEHQFGLRLYGYSRAEVHDLFSTGFSEVCIDRYITTYGGGKTEQNDWLVTVRK